MSPSDGRHSTLVLKLKALTLTSDGLDETLQVEGSWQSTELRSHSLVVIAS